MQSQETKTIMDETRRSIVDEILAMGDLKGDKEYHELAKLVCTSLGNISKVVENYYRYHGEKKQTQTGTLEKLKQEHKKISTKIENIVNAIAESGASALLSSLESLEEQRNIITQKI